MDGELAPGTRLRVRELSDILDTSPMPVRDAINRLIESGLATYEPYKGSRVSRLDPKELEDAYDARILLEGGCIRRGADIADESVAAKMHEHWEKLQAAAKEGDAETALKCDEAFLTEIYTVIDNEVLLGIIRSLWDKCRRYRMIWATGPGDFHDLERWQYKPDLLDAVRANDGAEAERLLRESYELAKEAISQRIIEAPARPRRSGQG